MSFKNLFLGIVGLLSFTSVVSQSCSAQETQNKVSAFNSVEAEDFSKAISADSVMVLDVRTAKEYAEGHIANSTNIDVLAADFETRIKSLPKNKTMAVYCRSGRRSKRAASVLVQNGFMVIELNSGFLGWVAAGKSVVK